MKKILYLFMISIIGGFSCVSVVNAETQYKEGNWVQEEGNCADFTTELSSSYTTYTFDAQTGLFNVTNAGGEKYQSGTNYMLFYNVSSDGKTLYAYMPEYNKNAVSLDSLELGIPAAVCDQVYKVSKTADLSTGNANNDTNISDESNDSTQDEVTNIADNVDLPEDETLDSEQNITTENNSTAEQSVNNQTVQTTDNPSTGIGEYTIIITAFILVAGVALILKKDKLSQIFQK